MTHTPGPWTLGTRHPGRVLARGSVNGFVAMVCALAEDTASPSEQELANARLIAAAPALKDAVQEMLDNLDEIQPTHLEALGLTVVLDKLRAAIAKATGE